METLNSRFWTPLSGKLLSYEGHFSRGPVFLSSASASGFPFIFLFLEVTGQESQGLPCWDKYLIVRSTFSDGKLDLGPGGLGQEAVFPTPHTPHMAETPPATPAPGCELVPGQHAAVHTWPRHVHVRIEDRAEAPL